MRISAATRCDINDVLKLQEKYHVASIAEDDKSSGFVTTRFTASQLTRLIEDEAGLCIARDGGQLLGYVMAASWNYWSAWPIFAYMASQLHHLTFAGQSLSTANSYQYGPVCIDKTARAGRLLASLFEFSRLQMANRYPVLVTFINKTNIRSFSAHTRKLGLQVIQEFEFNGNRYDELAYDTSRKVEFSADGRAGG